MRTRTRLSRYVSNLPHERVALSGRDLSVLRDGYAHKVSAPARKATFFLERGSGSPGRALVHRRRRSGDVPGCTSRAFPGRRSRRRMKGDPLE